MHVHVHVFFVCVLSLCVGLSAGICLVGCFMFIMGFLYPMDVCPFVCMHVCACMKMRACVLECVWADALYFNSHMNLFSPSTV